MSTPGSPAPATHWIAVVSDAAVIRGKISRAERRLHGLRAALAAVERPAREVELRILHVMRSGLWTIGDVSRALGPTRGRYPNTARARPHMGVLAELGLIETAGHQDRSMLYRITPAGRAAVEGSDG